MSVKEFWILVSLWQRYGWTKVGLQWHLLLRTPCTGKLSDTLLDHSRSAATYPFGSVIAASSDTVYWNVH